MLLPTCILVGTLLLVAAEYPTTLGKVPLEEPQVSPGIATPREQRVPIASADWTASAFNLPKALQSLAAQSLFLPVLFARTASTLLADKQCGRDALRFLEELGNGTLWAARMYDASAKLPDGVLFGSTDHYGNFDECYYDGIEGFGTRYCLIDAGYERRNLQTDYLEADHRLDPTGSLWQFLSVKPGFPVTDKTMLRLALCAPASCTPSDIELSLRKSLEHTLTNRVSQAQVPFSVSVKPKNCQAFSDQPTFSLPTRVYCAVILAIAIAVTRATIRHGELFGTGKEFSFLEKLLLCFTVQGSLSKLLQKERSDDTLDILDGIRVILTGFVVMGHRYMQLLEVSIVNSESEKLETYNSYGYLMLLNATTITDVFFCMSVTLATKSWLESLGKGKSLRFYDVVVKRYVRLTPSYALIVFFYILVLPRIGSGSLWGIKVESEAECCRDNWWLNLLYINNYAMRELCMFQSWHLSADFQAHCLAYLVVRLFWKLPRARSYSLLIFLIIAACILCSYITYISRLPPTLIVGYDKDTYDGRRLEDIRDMAYFFNYYIKTHMRLGVIFLGVLVGAMIYDLKSMSRPLPKFCFGICARLVLVILLGLNHLWIARYIWKIASPLETIIYAGFNRSFYTFVFALLWISLAFADRSDKARRFFSADFFHLISKLTYGVILSHHINHMYEIGSLRSPKTFNRYVVVTDVILDMIIGLLISTVSWFLVESPVRELYNLFSRKRISAVSKAD